MIFYLVHSCANHLSLSDWAHNRFSLHSPMCLGDQLVTRWSKIISLTRLVVSRLSARASALLQAALILQQDNLGSLTIWPKGSKHRSPNAYALSHLPMSTGQSKSHGQPKFRDGKQTPLLNRKIFNITLPGVGCRKG